MSWSDSGRWHIDSINERSDEASQFVEDRLRGLLESRVGYVIGGLRQQMTKHGLSGSRCKTLKSVITYLENNREHVRYDECIAAGYTIDSGVAEEVCRHLVKDRYMGRLWRSGRCVTPESFHSRLRDEFLERHGFELAPDAREAVVVTSGVQPSPPVQFTRRRDTIQVCRPLQGEVKLLTAEYVEISKKS